ncbi:hypothetical protein BKA67DRAFT_87908 [Truncatella angustata]|uniref:MARVEL domain-containing protein n=1 Tax=Truncatella angustata TaxID=152316 RepID=A0A9P8RMI4_9PEZI|nr:uncharacterized protein BKA67DRAFT_87908 [Truncatella angustata]KAH6645851.1 hypothetical protein BKA67DRAFT_87908 [Truncatella angustata]KAH8201979.1 hypothetical protein TruAng_003822 [Truncatella angustata]
MSSTHKIISVCFRAFEFGCAIIILGILARFFHLINQFNGPKDSRLVYAISMAAISVPVSLILLPPLKYSFFLFPLDFALFTCWIVCFALLEDLSGTSTCTASWYNTYWGVYWVSGPGNTTIVTTSACSKWRAVLAFSFIIAFCWLINAFLGLYAGVEYHNLGALTVSTVSKCLWWRKPKAEDLERDGQKPEESQNLHQVGKQTGPTG